MVRGGAEPVAGGILAAALAQPAAAMPPHPPPAEVNQALQKVLARPEFAPSHELGLPAWLLKHLDALFRWLGGLYDTAPTLFWLLIVGCLILLVLLLTHIVWTVRSAFFVATRGAAPGRNGEKHRILSEAYRDEARQQAARGDFTEAIRFLFLSLVFRLDERGSVSYQKAYTNREYLALFADRPQMHAVLKVFVDALDQHWYGRIPTDRQLYDACLGLFESLA